MRNRSRTVTFQLPFVLPELPGLQQAGSYIVDTEAEEVKAASPPISRLVRTVLRLVNAGMSQMIEIDPENLEKALRQDRDNAGLLRFAKASNQDFEQDAREGDDPVEGAPARAMITKR